MHLVNFSNSQNCSYFDRACFQTVPEIVLIMSIFPHIFHNNNYCLQPTPQEGTMLLTHVWEGGMHLVTIYRNLSTAVRLKTNILKMYTKQK